MREVLQRTFNKIYCINLDSRPDKWKSCVEQFEEYNILDLVEQFPAVKSTGFLGGTLSHLQCIRNAKQYNYKSVFILEDDFEFLRYVWTKNQMRCVESKPELYINRALDQLKNVKWDLLFFSYKLPHRSVINYKNISRNLFQSTHQLWTSGYAVNSSAYDFILDNAMHGVKLFNYALDQFYARVLSHKLICLNVKPIIIGQRPCHGDVNNQYTDYTRHAKNVSRRFYRALDEELLN